MTFFCLKEKDFLNLHYLKKPILESELNEFIKALKNYKINLENNLKNNEDSLVANALNKFFENLHFKCEVKSIHKGNSGIDLALKKDNFTQVIIEAKLPNSKEFFSLNKPNCKALHECILYYFRERKASNSSLKYIIITNFYSFFIFRADLFEELFCKNKYFEKAFENFEEKGSVFKGNTDEIYKEFEKILNVSDITLKGLFVDLRPVLEQDKPGFVKLKSLFKIFHRDFLLNEFKNDSNALNLNFYNELLYILGLCESKENGKTTIDQSKESKEGQGTFYTAISSKLKDENFETILKFLILWLNRILFLKLIESNLVRFNNDKNLKFLNFKKIFDFDKLSELFFEVLAKEKNARNKSEFAYLPYLNSSLFEKQECEKNLLEISALSNDLKLTYYKNTVLKDEAYKAKKGQIGLLEYLFAFLDSFDFGSDDEQNEILEQKDLISSSVLGKVFEKLNGYKEGSFYTPGFITSYMCKESITKIVLDKFNAKYNFQSTNLNELDDELYKALKKKENKEDKAKLKEEFKELLKGIKICDPAVGSGHFLVSSLNTMLEIYSKLNLLENNFTIEVSEDELIIKNRKDELVEYERPSNEKEENHLIQQELFYLKQSIIENNLFGVDINANSCEITKLRLWIELLKHSFYKKFNDKNYHNLETLPNIDINIKCGNSLVSRFNLNDKFTNNNIKFQVEKYKEFVKDYKNPSNAVFSVSKDELRAKIKDIKQVFILELKSPKDTRKLEDAIKKHMDKFGKAMLDDVTLLDLIAGLNIGVQKPLFERELTVNEQKEAIDSSFKIKAMRAKIDYELSGEKFKNAFEWRFEFPEILDDENGNFKGFDLIIGNPPYIRQEDIKELKPLLKDYKVYKGTSDIYTYFYELGFNLLKEKGVLSFITSNKYTRAGYGEALREFLLKNTTILSYTDLNGVKVFDSATVDTSILSFEKAKSKNNKFKYLALNNELLKACNDNISLCKDYKELSQKSLSKESFTFSDESINLLKAKIERIGTQLKDWYGLSINYGIKTGYNEAFIIDTEKRNELLANCKDEAEKERTAKLIRKMLRGRDIKRYSYEWAGLWLINTHNGYKSKDGEKIEAIDIKDYPSLKKHFDEFYPQLEKRTDKGKTPYNLRNCAYVEDFAKEKIVYSEIVRKPQFYLDTNLNFYAEATSFILTGEHLKYLIAFLNNDFVAFIFKTFYAGGNLGENGFRYKKAFIEKIPIPKINAKNQKIANEIKILASEILELKKEKADTKELERKLDELVYKLYDLNEEEIALIENKFAGEARGGGYGNS